MTTDTERIDKQSINMCQVSVSISGEGCWPVVVGVDADGNVYDYRWPNPKRDERGGWIRLRMIEIQP